MATEINVDTTKKSPLIDEEDDIFAGVEPLNEECLKEAEKKAETDIPSNYIAIRLLSNGRVENIPKVLHFRDYSVAESQELNTFAEERPKAIANVLTKMNFEKFDCCKLPIQDILFILYSIQANFISGSITKTIYLDESLEEGDAEGQLNNANNLEEVEIPINRLNFTYLGKDKNDKDLPRHIKVPFTIVDKVTHIPVSFKIVTLEDSLLAENYCKELYRDDFNKFSPLRREIDSINEIRDTEKQKATRDAYIDSNYQLCKDYYKFMVKYEDTKAHLIQALQIVSYNGKVLDSISEKWEVYSTQITRGLWKSYIDTVENYSFGVNNEVEVYSNKLDKKLVRTFGFQLFDFLLFDRPENTDRYDVLFD